MPPPLAQAGEELVQYQSRLPHAAHLIDLLMDGQLAPNPKLYTEWRDFLLALEPLVEKGTISKEQVEQFKRQIAALRESGALPLWLTFFFPQTKISDPLVSRMRAVSSFLDAVALSERLSSFLITPLEDMRIALERAADQRLVTLSGAERRMKQRLDNYLGQISQEQLDQLKILQQRRQKLDEIRMQLDAFGKPESFIHAWNTLKEEIESFWSSEERTRALVRSPSSLVRMIACQTMVEAVTLLDEAVKAAKQSASFPNDASKVARFKTMLEPYFQMMHTWSTLVTPGTIPTADGWPIDLYVHRVRIILSQLSTSDISMLFASPNFSVNAAILGTRTAFERHYPITLEDCLTLMHQNCLVFVNSLNMELLTPATTAKAALPHLLKSTISTMESFQGFIRPQRIGVRITATQVTMSYNVPLRNHSGQIDLIYDKLTDQLSLRGHLLGQARDRWPTTAKWVQAMQHVGLFIPDQPLHQGEQSLTFFWRIPNPENLAYALQEYDAMARYSLDDLGGFIGLPQRWISRGRAKALELGIQCFNQELEIQGFDALIEEDLAKKLDNGSVELNTVIRFHKHSWLNVVQATDPIAYIEQSDFSDTKKALMLAVIHKYSFINVLATIAHVVPPSQAFIAIFKLDRLGFNDLVNTLTKKAIRELFLDKEIQDRVQQAVVGKRLIEGLLDAADELLMIGKRREGNALLNILVKEYFDESLESRIIKLMDSLDDDELRDFVDRMEKNFLVHLVQKLSESAANDGLILRLLRFVGPITWSSEFKESITRFASRAIHSLSTPDQVFTLLLHFGREEIVVNALRVTFGQFRAATKDVRLKAGNIAIQVNKRGLNDPHLLRQFNHLIKSLALSDHQSERAFAVCFYWYWVWRRGGATPLIERTVAEMQQSQDPFIREDGARLARLIEERNPKAFKTSEEMIEWE